ncbi:MAG TPA: ROK family protein [Nevskiales bacterium]|nr:ROK family protein [Nevskiales bacterium]
MRIGIDLGGSKIEGVLMDADSSIRERLRVPTPAGDYVAIVNAIRDLVQALEQRAGRRDLKVGIGTPGSVSPATGRMRGCNSTCLNGRPLARDLEAALGRPVRLANDANCLALSEARDGAGRGARSVFGVILGTGVGGGVVIAGQLIAGANGIAGEWGHNPLPWPRPGEVPGPRCWCGRQSCLETWLSGPSLSREYLTYADADCTAAEIAQRLEQGEAAARAVFARYCERLARALASVINLLDPEVIVLGGGLSNIRMLYTDVPALWTAHVFSDRVATRLLPAAHGDSSGVRGAAWLWPGFGSEPELP